MSKKQIIVLVILVLLISAYVGVKIYASNIAEEKVNEFISKTGEKLDVDYKNVSVDLFRMNVVISDVVLSNDDNSKKLMIDEIIIKDVDRESKIPTFLSVACNGIKMNTKDFGKNAKMIKALGYGEEIKINTDIDYVYNKEKKEINLKNIGIGADEVGEVSLGIRIGNINLDPEKISELLFTFPQLTFYEAEIQYADDSLLDRLMKHWAKEEGVEVDEFKKKAFQAYQAQIDEEDDEFTKKTMISVKKFLERPGKISISATPEKKVPLINIIEVKKPQDVIKLLNIEIDS